MQTKPWENKPCKTISATVVTTDGVLVAACVTPDRAQYVCEAINQAVERRAENLSKPATSAKHFQQSARRCGKTLAQAELERRQ